MSTPRLPKSLKTILVQPSSRQGVRSLFTFHKNEGIGHKPPLGIMILATYLRREGFSDVQCLDAQLDDLTPEETVDRLEKARPDVVGLTVWTDFWYAAWKTIRLLRERLPECVVVLGGPHCSVYPSETLQGSGAHYLVAGDGEDALLGLLEALDEGRRPEAAPGLWRRDGDDILPPPAPFAVVKDLKRIPAPDRLLLPYKRYNSLVNASDYETTMVTSRGCPHKCVFCKMHAQQVYARSAEQVVEEFKAIADLGISDIQVYDDTFTWSKQRVVDICTGILDHGLKVKWAIRDRVDRVSPEAYALMRRAGCYRVHFGVESGSWPILKASGKGITMDQVRRSVEISKKTGFDTLAFYMFGFLDETYEDARKTIDFAIELDTHYAVFAVLIPYPGTSLYEEALRRGIVPRDFWREFTLNPEPDYRIPHLVENVMDRKTLIGLKDLALRKYYFRPKAIFRELRSVCSVQEFRRKASMALTILTDSLPSIRRAGADG